MLFVSYHEYMNAKTTSELQEILKHTDSESELSDVLQDDKMIPENMTFSDYFFTLPDVNENTKAEIVRNSGIDRTYAYQILNNTRKNPSKDKIIALCLAAHTTLDQARRALKISGCADLYARNKRDAVIIYAFHHHLEVQDLNNLLNEFEEPVLGE